MHRTKASALGFLVVVALVGGGCGGCDEEVEPPPPPPPPVVAITISPTSVILPAGGAQLFTASVTGTANTAVTWSATAGSITSLGQYGAPSTPGVQQVTATSVADPTKKAVAEVTVTWLVTIFPDAVTLNAGQVQTFTATVPGAPSDEVTWTASDGTMSAEGAFTAPSAVGSYEVVATSIHDTNARGAATVTVSADPQTYVTLSPATVTLNPHRSQQFTATVTGATDTSVTWSLSGAGSITPGGLYTAPSKAPGLVHVVATSVENAQKSAVARVALEMPSISGTVTYTGSHTGRVYITAQNSGGGIMGGTSIAAPGAFTIRGLQNQGPVTLEAWMDTLGEVMPSRAVDPNGSVQVNLSGTSVTGVALPITNPAPVTPPRGALEAVFGGDGGALALFRRVEDGQGRETADHYRVYASTGNSPGPGNSALTRDVTATSVDVAIMAPLTNGVYYFAVAAVNNGTVGQVSPAVGPVTVGPRTGGNTVSGTISLSGIPTGGSLFVIAFSESLGAYFTRIASPSGAQSYSIAGVPAGAFELVAFLDRNDDGQISSADLVLFENNVGVTVAGADVTAPPLAFPSTDALVNVFTRKSLGFNGEHTDLEFSVQSNLKLPVRVALLSGPNVGAPIDLGVSTFEGEGRVRFSAHWRVDTAAIGDDYRFEILYADGSTATPTPEIQGLVGVPTLLGPISVGSETPTFNWIAPSPAPASYRLSVRPRFWNGDNTWQARAIDGGATSVEYDFDGTADQPALTPGQSYEWNLDAVGAFGDSSRAGAMFRVPARVTISPTSATLNAGQTQFFSSTVDGASDPGVTWSATGGTLVTLGRFAWFTAGSTNGGFQVTAASTSEPDRTAPAAITITGAPEVGVRIEPRTGTLQFGQTQRFFGKVENSADPRVVWSVREGSSGGTVNANGVYLAPNAAGTYHVVATSVANTAKTAVAKMVVSAGAQPRVTIDQPALTMVVEQTQTFTATLSGTAGPVTWSLIEPNGGTIDPTTGVYEAPDETGVFHIKAAVAAGGETRVDFATVAVELPYLTGTVTYSGNLTGRIYINMQQDGYPIGGTSLAAPGAFLIRGIRAYRYCSVTAWRDSLGTAYPNAAADPMASTEIQVPIGANITGMVINLIDPVAQAPSKPHLNAVFPSDQAAGVIFEGSTDAFGNRGMADHYKVYASTSAAMTSPVLVRTVRSGTFPFVPMAPLTNGAYFFGVSGVAGGLEGPMDVTPIAVNVAAASGATTVSGTLLFPGLTPTGPAYAITYNDQVGAFFSRVGGLTGTSAAFSIAGVPTGTYEVVAAIDMGNDGELGPLEPMLMDGTVVNASGSAVTVPPLTFPSQPALARLLSLHSKFSPNSDYTDVTFTVTGQTKIPVKATVVSGPHGPLALDMAFDQQFGDGRSRFLISSIEAPYPPLFSDVYRAAVEYSDGTTELLTASLEAVLSFPTVLTPAPNANLSSPPTFSWAAPSPAPAAYSYSLEVRPLSGRGIWYVYSIPSTTTSMDFNEDGRAWQTLQPSTSYEWFLTVTDTKGNRSRILSTFDFQFN